MEGVKEQILFMSEMWRQSPEIALKRLSDALRKSIEVMDELTDEGIWADVEGSVYPEFDLTGVLAALRGHP